MSSLLRERKSQWRQRPSGELLSGKQGGPEKLENPCSGHGKAVYQFCEWTHTEHIFLYLFLASHVTAEKLTEPRDKNVKVTGYSVSFSRLSMGVTVCSSSGMKKKKFTPYAGHPSQSY